MPPRRLSFLAVLAVAATFAACSSQGGSSPKSSPAPDAARAADGAGGPRVRKIRFSYEALVPEVPAGTRELRLWIPAPQRIPGVQEVVESSLSTEGLAGAVASEHSGPGGTNSWWHVVVPNPTAPVKVVASMTVVRREVLNNYFRGAGKAGLGEAERASFREELGPYDLVPVGGRFEGIAAQIAVGETNVVTVARQIYDHVLAHMKYSKEGTGWGRGDANWACDSRFGNCTDFHSLFMSLAKTKGIPVRFHMGFPIPEARGTGKVGGYHCWAEFWTAETGWVPVDISEADKFPELAQYYFGALTEDRIQFVTGRDLVLDPAPASGKRNLFIYPYAEADGKEVKTDKAFAYTDV